MKEVDSTQSDTKKAYRKPSLTVHGTLTQLTRGGEEGDLEAFGFSTRIVRSGHS